MKRSILILALFNILIVTSVVAQPKARRQQQAQKQQQQQQKVTAQNQGISQRARLMYPTSLDMPEDVVWRRDIYREINLNDEANSGLYYPVEPIDRKMNLFTYVFKLALNGYIPIYEYRLDGNESFSDSSKVAIKTMLDNYHIIYETREGKLHVDNSDIPSAEVKMYYLKESAYYDQSNAQFRRKVMALCPVMVRDDDFGGEAAKYPLFWVKYTDLEPYLSRQSVQASDLNNAATMTLEDYFTLNHYQGKIYKAGNRMAQTQQRPQFGEFDATNVDDAAKAFTDTSIAGNSDIMASLQSAYDDVVSKFSGPALATGKGIGENASGKLVQTASRENAVTITAARAGVEGQIAGFSISISDADGNVKKAANASLDQFKETIRAQNASSDNALNFHVGAEANVAIKVGMTDMRSEALGLKGSDGTKLNIGTKEKANAAVNVLDNAIQKAIDQQTTIGAIEARLEYTSSNLTTSSENVQAAESTIRDADMAKEMTNYTKNNVLLQAAQSMLAQANQNSSAVLSLLQ